MTIFTCPRSKLKSLTPWDLGSFPPVANCLARLWWKNKFRQQGYMIRGICPPGKSLGYYHVVCAVRVGGRKVFVGQCVVHRQEGSVCVSPFLIISLSLSLTTLSHTHHTVSRSLSLSLSLSIVCVSLRVSREMCVALRKRFAQEREGELLM